MSVTLVTKTLTANSKTRLAVGAANTVIECTAGEGTLFPSVYPYYLILASDDSARAEIVEVSARSTDEFTVTRGVLSTTAVAHPAGEKIELITGQQINGQDQVIGAFSSTAANYGVPLSSSMTAAFRVYSDDAGGALYASGSVPDLRGGLSRLLITSDQSGGDVRLWGFMGQLKVSNTMIDDEEAGALCGRTELIRTSGTVQYQGYGITSAVHGILATRGTILNDSNHILAGVASVSDIQATLTQTGVVAAFYAGIYNASQWSDGTARAKWTYALFADTSAVTRGISMGKYTSTVDNGLYAFGATWLNGFFADDSGDNQAAGVYRNLIARTYFTVDQSTGSADYDVIRGHIKAASGVDFGGEASSRTAIRGYAEFAGITTIGASSFFGAVMGELWTDNNLIGTGICAALLARIYGAAGAASGVVAGLAITKQWATYATQIFTHGVYIQDGSVATGNDIRLQGGATISSGSAEPSHSATQGSIYLRTGQAIGATLYVNTNGTTGWTLAVLPTS